MQARRLQACYRCPLLVCMMMGALCVNLTEKSAELQRRTDKITPPIFMLFFVISGAELDVAAIGSIGVVGAVYIVARVAGKMFGAWLGAVINVRQQLRNISALC